MFITGSELSFSVIGSNSFKGPEFFVVDLHVEVIMSAASCRAHEPARSQRLRPLGTVVEDVEAVDVREVEAIENSFLISVDLGGCLGW